MEGTYQERRQSRHTRIRRNVFGTHQRPRLCIFRSEKHLYAQAVDDYARKTLFAFSTTNEKFRKAFSKGSTVEAGRKLGEIFGPELIQKGIQKIVFDRGGHQYHGRVKALAEALRKAGLDF